MTEITIHTGARLHFGFFSYGQPTLRQFGGIGAMIDRPGFSLRVTRASVDSIRCGDWNGRVGSLLARLREISRVGALAVEANSTPPAHAGLGSGTQLGMALAQVVALLGGETDLSPETLALRSGRGLRSAIGLHGFIKGGLLVEAGQSATQRISPLAAHAEVPADWRFLLIRPTDSAGLSGADEACGFSKLSPMPIETTDRLCRLAIMEFLPAVIEADYLGACRALGEYGRQVGDYFSPVQGGVFAHPRMRLLGKQIAARGSEGFGQSSWGPTLFVLCENTGAAEQLKSDLSQYPEGINCDYTIAAPLNRGAEIKFQTG